MGGEGFFCSAQQIVLNIYIRAQLPDFFYGQELASGAQGSQVIHPPNTPPLGSPPLVPDKHHVLKDLPFNEVACATDSQTHQDRLEQKEKKKSERDAQVSSAYQLFSLQLQCPSSYQEEERTCHSACSKGKDAAIRFPIFSFHFVFLSVFIFFGYQHRVEHKS